MCKQPLLEFKVINGSKYLLHGYYCCEKQAMNQVICMEKRGWKVLRQYNYVYIRDCTPIKH